eukprot:16224867-Heterocapsa_arctica.AAC.1
MSTATTNTMPCALSTGSLKAPLLTASGSPTAEKEPRLSELVDVTGNMFDKDALLSRMADAVLSWAAGAGT